MLGYLVWKNSTENEVIDNQLIDKILPEYQLALNRNAYTKIYQDYLTKIVNLFVQWQNSTKDKVKMKFISKQMDKPNNYLSNYRQRLLDSQLIRVSGYGYVMMTP